MSKSYDVLKLCEKKGDTYEIDPAVMFPATLDRIQACVSGESPTEIVTPGWKGRADRERVADSFLRQAEAVPDEGWDLAKTPFAVLDALPNETEEEKAVRTYKLQLRAEVLALAEQWWKRAIALAHGGRGVKVYIKKNLDWRR